MQRQLLLLAAGLAVVGACTAPPVSPTTHLASAVTAPAATIWADSVLGETGPGSLYAIYKPTNWNREVVYYAHGFVDAALPPAIPTTQDGAGVLRDSLGARGYAVAMSSFSSNGYDFPDGLRRMHQLRGLVRSRIGQPKADWLTGHSLGAQISQGLAEQYGGQYDGALLMCGVLGGTQAHFQWLGDVRVLFDFFYPGVLPGDVSSWPDTLDPYTYIPPRVFQAVVPPTGNPNGLLAIAAIDQSPLAGANFPELLQSLITDLVWHARGIGDVTGRTQGHMPYGNAGRVYTDNVAPIGVPAAVLAAVNAGVGRFTSPPDAQNWLARNYEPTGNLSFPVLTLHTTRDQSVPFFHEGLFAAAVAGAGNSSWLVQRSVNVYGHCNFTVGQVLTAFSDLVTWAKTGVPATP